ncbi:MAG: DinB family protein [Acidobacteriota bacterium]
MPHQASFGRALISQCERRLFSESLPRVKKCLSQLTEEEIWHRPNPETVSAGNLVLHLCGNVRQWIVSGLGGAPDIRERSREFSELGPISSSQLVERLESTLAEARSVLKSVDPEHLLEERTVQGFRETGLSILVHVVEHFSYHVGQITYFVKSRKAMDLKYYQGVDLDRTGNQE